MRISPSPNVPIKRERNIVVVRTLPIDATVSEVLSLFSHSSEHRSWRSVALIELVFKHTGMRHLMATVPYTADMSQKMWPSCSLSWSSEARSGQQKL